MRRAPMTHFEGPTKAAFRRGALIASLALAGFAGPALAADPSVRAPIVQAVVDCRKVEDTAQRLACYDAAVARMEEAETKGDLVTVDREQRAAARRQAFGFNLPSLDFLNRGEKPEDVDRVTLTVDSARQDANGRWTLKMSDGAVWRQIDSNDLPHPPHAGSTATVRKGALGSFIMNVDGHLGFKVHRDN